VADGDSNPGKFWDVDKNNSNNEKNMGRGSLSTGAEYQLSTLISWWFPTILILPISDP